MHISTPLIFPPCKERELIGATSSFMVYIYKWSSFELIDVALHHWVGRGPLYRFMRPRQNVTVRLDSHAPWILLERSGGSVSVTHDNVMTHHATAACPPVRTLQIIERRLVVLSARLQPPPGLHQRSRRTVPFHRRSSGQFPSSPRQQKN
jgi:hypothetical protein